MIPVVVRNVKIGEGIPKICVPVVGETKSQILENSRKIVSAGVDLVEWRADWYEDIFCPGSMEETLIQLRKILGDIPVLFTFRTFREGGKKEIETSAYVELNKKAVRTGTVDIIDAELFSGEDAVKSIIDFSHACGVKVIASNHDFNRTPEKNELISRLCRMQEIGADILKIAVMPRSRKDVLTLLEATEEMYTKYADRPLITMSMSRLGVISRMSGEIFGSTLTFGTVGEASAPGQIQAQDLKEVLGIIHESFWQ